MCLVDFRAHSYQSIVEKLLHRATSQRQSSLKLNTQYALYVAHLVIEARGSFEGAVWFEGALALRVFELDREIVANLIYQDDCLLIKPLHSLTVLPQPVLDVAFCVVYVCSKAMLLTLVPPALVFTAICPVVNTEAFFFIHEVLAIVANTVSVNIDSMTLHIVGLPLTVVLAAILPEVDAVTMNLVIEPLAFVSASISPSIFAMALLLAHYVFTLVFGAFRPSLNTVSMLLVFLPVSFITRTFDVGVNSEAVRFVVHPSAVVDVTISMEKLAVSAGLVILPVALVAS